MPYEQQRFVSLTEHDAANWDVFVTYRHRAQGTIRYSVIMPKTSSRDALFKAAIGLAAFVRLENRISSVFVRRDHLYTAQRTAEVRARHARELAERNARLAAGGPVAGHIVVPDPDLPAYRSHQPPAPSAEAVARELLRGIDPDLLQKMERGIAFYFTTPSHRYIFYPRDRAVVSLEEEGPKYCCVHSRDYAVETNTYDWAITMRTYLLAAEEHWRRKSNYHTEYGLRGGKEAYDVASPLVIPTTES